MFIVAGKSDEFSIVMRGILFILFCVFIFSDANSQKKNTFPWYDFETSSTLPNFVSFGTDYEVFENPDPSPTNPSLLVGRVVKIPGESIGWSGVFINTPRKMNPGSGAYLKMKVYATSNGGTIQVKLETDPQTHNVYSLQKIDRLNEWQDLIFRFDKKNQRDYTKLVIVFDYGGVEEHVYYFDDVVWVEEG